MKKAFYWVFLVLPFVVFWKLDELNIYTIDISKVGSPIISGHLKLGSNKSPSGETLDANSLYFIKNGNPWYPVMGEIHFSRYPRAQWEESILKMKAAGIDVIASYVFWIYHEETEGTFNWSGDNDLRAFAELCKKHNVYFFARIGPWCHGEVRNGGLPDWLLKRGNVRKNDRAYLVSVEKFYDQIGKQLNGLYFKDGGPVIGSQIENEYRFNNPAGLEHMLTLKKLAQKAGIDVPFYSATGWPGSNQKQDELIPVWGAYPEAPWDKKTTKLPLSENYMFGSLRNDPAIGSDLLGQHEQQADFKGYRYPYATAEMGGGNQITYHRRPIIDANDVTSLTYVKVGSGANLMGYYMFHGGSNPIGKLSTLQESKATKYPNDYPIISYDFLAPIGEWGQLRPSYKGFKVIHTFLNEFGDRLVQYSTSFPERKPESPSDNSLLRMSVRSKENRGFIFVSNFQRQLQMKDIHGVQFHLKLKDSVLRFPQTPIQLKRNLQLVFPFNMDLDGLNLNYATAQPLCRLEGAEPVYVFFAPDGILPEFSFNKSDIKTAELHDASLIRNDKAYTVRVSKPGTNCTMKLTLQNGKVLKILTLTNQQALNAWKADVFGAERLFISKSDLIFFKEKIRLQSTGSPEINFAVYPALPGFKFSRGKLKTSAEGIFSVYNLKLPVKNIKADIKEVRDLEPYLIKGGELPLDDRNPAVNTAVSPGPQYQTNLNPVEGAKYYEVKLPLSTLNGLSDAFIKVDYTGDTGAAYLNGKLIADDFYSGLPMTIGIKRFGNAFRGKKLLFQIVPLTDERKIYFEDGVREPLKGKQAGGLKSVNIIPQYEVFLSQ
jgi:beta-galactosidase